MFDGINTIYPKLSEHKFKEDNRIIYNYLRLFSNNKALLAFSLIHEPFSEITNQLHSNAQEIIGPEVIGIMEVIQKCYTASPDLLEEYTQNKEVITYFLACYRYLFNTDNTSTNHPFLTKEKVQFATSLLELSDISEIRSDLEDQFFNLLEPTVFNHYQTLIQFTKETYKAKELEIITKISDLLEQENINFQIKSRVKSIFSIHKKITKKKILYSQVLDTIGLRILVENEKDCYRVMGIILKYWDAMNNKVKDYIAVPKTNNYQSIHLTILHQGHPAEIQIRTKGMEESAQFGLAAHHQYKALA